MAKLRFPMSQSKLAARIESFMDRKAAVASGPYVTSRAGRKALLAELDGMTKLAEDMGIKCECFHTQWAEKPRYVCKCRIMTKKERSEMGIEGVQARPRYGYQKNVEEYERGISPPGACPTPPKGTGLRVGTRQKYQKR